jgi:hypothetical protein
MTTPTRSAVWFRTGPPWRLGGRTVRGHALRYGVLLPPASGLARAAALEAEGLRLLGMARREYGRVLRELLVAAGSAVPPPADLANPRWPEAGRALAEARRAGWRRTRRQLTATTGMPPRSATTGRGALDLDALEQRSRAALRTAVAAFDYLEDTALAADAHMHAHTIGELVAGVFGCRAELKDGRWFDVCPLSLMHLRAGSSVGFVARRHCSVCGRDIADCEHLPEATYPMVAARPDGECTICGTAECVTHVPGTLYQVEPHAVVREIDRLDEISIVARPRDPLARFEAVEIPAQAVAALPGSDAPDGVLECQRCVSPCTGFTSVEEALGLA